jgi:hypothetical protein
MGAKALWTKINPPPKKKVVKRIRKVSVKRAKQLNAYESSVRAFMDQHLICQRCHVFPSIHCHHSRGRIGMLLLAVQFWRALCVQCHTWCHAHPDAARREGLICEKGKWNSHD